MYIVILSCSISLASLKLFCSNSLSDSQFGGNTSSNSYRTQGKESGFSPSYHPLQKKLRKSGNDTQ